MAYFFRFDYDVVLFFASADRHTAEEFARLLAAKNIKVSLDEVDRGSDDNREVMSRLAESLRKKARYFLLLISRSLPMPAWPDLVRLAAGDRDPQALSDFLVPVRLDDNEVPASDEPKEVRDLRLHSVEDIANGLADAILREKRRPGPPSQSHDLRSGNVPPARD